MAVVAAPVIVLARPEWVPYVLVMTALPLSLLNTWHQRAGLCVRDMIVPMVTRVPGTLIGAWILLHIDVFWLQIAVSASVLLAVLASVRSVHFEATPVRLGWAGLLGGFMGTTTSVGGPPMALVMQHGDPLSVRANLSLYFTFGVTLSLLSYGAAGLLDGEVLLAGLSFLPCALAGFVLGAHTRRYVDAGRFRAVLLWICGAAALIAMAGAILG